MEEVISKLQECRQILMGKIAVLRKQLAEHPTEIARQKVNNLKMSKAPAYTVEAAVKELEKSIAEFGEPSYEIRNQIDTMETAFDYLSRTFISIKCLGGLNIKFK